MFNSVFQSGGPFPHYKFLNHCYRMFFLTVHLYSHYLKVVATFTKHPRRPYKPVHPPYLYVEKFTSPLEEDQCGHKQYDHWVGERLLTLYSK